MMKKNFFYWMTILMVAIVSVNLMSCGDDDDDEGSSGMKGWYTVLGDLPSQSDFNKLNEAINKQEVLSSYTYGGKKYTYVASRDLFINSDGSYQDDDAYFGRLRFTIKNPINAIRIVDDNTLISYVAFLYIDGASTGDVVYQLDGGSNFGRMTYYGHGSYYTYVKVDDKIIVSNGDIYSITSGGLIKDGSSSMWSKYNPKK